MSTGIIYRNPNPHVISRHAYFPSVVFMNNGEILASFAIGEAFESVDLDTYTAKSKDMGKTWSEPRLLLKKVSNHLYSNVARLAVLPGGQIIANVTRSNRELHPGEGLTNPENMGFVPTDLLVMRSIDFGNTWSAPEIIIPKLIGPSFEMCSPIVPLRDGRWLWPTSTWRGWDGYCPNGMKMVALISHDKGKTWPEHVDVMDGSADKVIYWEGKIAELTNGVLVAIAWAHDEPSVKSLSNHYTLSHDGGKTWLVPISTNIQGETMAITELPDEKLLVVYRRTDKPGLWGTIAKLEKDAWINEKAFPLWGANIESLLDKSYNMVQDFHDLKFGAPSITILPGNAVFVAFWCYEKMVSNIRWFKLSI